jgi:DNA-binding transcriptional LysR family regulator
MFDSDAGSLPRERGVWSAYSGGAKSIPPFAALRAFEAVGRLGGIRKAAAALSLHHAVVSRHVAALERWVGQPLLMRNRGNKLLTPTGSRYYLRIQDALRELASATAEIVSVSDGDRLRIWTNGGFASKWLAPRLGEFTALQPDVKIELRPSDARPDLLNGEAEVDIRYHGDLYSPPPGGKGLTHVELARPHIMAVASPSLLGAAGPIRSSADLLRLPLLHEEDDAQWRAWFAARGDMFEQEIPGTRLWHAHLAIGAAVEGRGVALASSFLVSDELRSGRLVEVPDPDAPTRTVPLGSYVFTTRADRWETPRLRQFRAWILRAVEADQGGRPVARTAPA